MSTVLDVTNILFNQFPADDSEEWDTVGLLVGDAQSEVKKIAVALDASTENIIRADEAGCQALVTHHPAFISLPKRLVHGISGDEYVIDSVWESIKRNVALIAMHTNLDRSQRARYLHADLLGLKPSGILERNRSETGIGEICIPAQSDTISVEEIARRASDVYDTDVSVSGDLTTAVKKIAVSSGSFGSLVDDAIAAGVDCVVTGECSYHPLLSLNQYNIPVVQVGHGPSEAVYNELLKNVFDEAGFEVEILPFKSSSHTISAR